VYELFFHNQKTEGLIFTFKGKSIWSLKTAWKTALRKSGIRRTRFHYLRHTFNTRLLELSVVREVRMALLGHTFGDTHENYEHVELPMKREAIRKLETWLGSEPPREEGGNTCDPERTVPGTAASGSAHSEDARRLTSPSDARVQ
jgi:integrase